LLVIVGMGSGGSSSGMAAYQHNSSGANNTGNIAASAGMHAMGNSPGTL